ncbi:hypothetical Protein YC6258_00621 [Gynuella sunshinyii YC6258]|uniref:Uncharacterized protein n=1 Tax=Gynuella sunshinyii YC6258 TaxID=1445510 RepID=A0A0C5VEP5_9GAMM|nr:hypothetical Protein YC6258_00621 [Gynuella sunshinyii YC6258]
MEYGFHTLSTEWEKYKVALATDDANELYDNEGLIPLI